MFQRQEANKKLKPAPPLQRQPDVVRDNTSHVQPSVSIEKHFSFHYVYICLCQISVEKKLYLLHRFLEQTIPVLPEKDAGSPLEDCQMEEEKVEGEVPETRFEI
jgi:hypothetical protein